MTTVSEPLVVRNQACVYLSVTSLTRKGKDFCRVVVSLASIQIPLELDLILCSGLLGTLRAHLRRRRASDVALGSATRTAFKHMALYQCVYDEAIL